MLAVLLEALLPELCGVGMGVGVGVGVGTGGRKNSAVLCSMWGACWCCVLLCSQRMWARGKWGAREVCVDAKQIYN